MADYIDNSYPPICQDQIQSQKYIRGDGAEITITVKPPADKPQRLLQRMPAPILSLHPHAALEGRPHQAPVVTQPPEQAASDIYDHPAIGGKFTTFVLLYGPSAYHPMHKRCLDAIISTVPPGRLDLRVGSNELCHETRAYVNQLQDAGTISKHYRHTTNDKKYPVMREMFYDPDHPITTKWLLWFDDDSIAGRNPQWLQYLSQQIIAGADHNCHMYGARFIWTLQRGQAEWIKTRPWYRKRPFRTATGKPVTGGDKIIFAAGGFWALSTEAMRACDIPDVELQHNGGDYTIGEQLYQGGYEMRAWNGQKQFVHTSSVPRRGLSEQHIGVKKQIIHRIVT